MDSILKDSLTLELSERESSKYSQVELQTVEPLTDLPYIRAENSVTERLFGKKISRLDVSLFHGRSGRIGWGPGTFATVAFLIRDMQLLFVQQLFTSLFCFLLVERVSSL